MAKLTRAEKLVQERMLALLEWAADRPQAGNQYRLKPKTWAITLDNLLIGRNAPELLAEVCGQPLT